MRDNSKVYIIAEISANHGGRYEDALLLIDKAYEAGADCVKIQTYTADTMTIAGDQSHFKIENGLWAGYTLHDLYQEAFTPWEWQLDLKAYAEKLGLDFLSTPFDDTSVDFLESIGVKHYKIASFELVDLPLIKYIASKQKPIILSTGMANLAEIEDAVKCIRSVSDAELTLLWCSSAYPTVSSHMNLKSMPILGTVFKTAYGLSDHSLGSIASVLAVAIGASVIEKHICLSRDLDTPDAAFSLEPLEFKQLVSDIREAEKALGTVTFERGVDEVKSMRFRRSLICVKDILPGEPLTQFNVKSMRPNVGLAPKHMDKVLTLKARKLIKRGDPISWELLE